MPVAIIVILIEMERIPKQNTTVRNGQRWKESLRGYLYVQCDRPFVDEGCYADGEKQKSNDSGKKEGRSKEKKRSEPFMITWAEYE